ncbi:chemotaxis response regulator protein-glutamate methylesterase [Paenibacillus lemnae]|uniref:Protein-glutamate methylesterase/protein-glutamine glutaminase n=2 Tax=Paenibacillus lemnae TaxID=1330551 RepID=A0A848M5U6_PAELE|nr:chemotaxis response regulator protein-glutamate methylesterase [Paenibacillus lemnae]
MKGRTIKVLVVDDSLFMRRYIKQLAEEDGAIEVIGTARNGNEGIRMVMDLRPDVVTMDVEMPGMNGLTALSKIMEELPTRVLMISSMTREGADSTIQALQSGAVDFIAKPSGLGPDMEGIKQEIISKIKAAARTPLSSLISARRKNRVNQVTGTCPKTARGACKFDQIIAIGTSTGGPKALETVLGGLPEGYPHPVLIVQHMPEKFTASLAERLNRNCRIVVKEAISGERLEGGTAYIAPGGYHMSVRVTQGKYEIIISQEEPLNRFRPSVDMLFYSVAALSNLQRHFILMTGMGSDGAKGMSYAKRHGAASTIVEAQETCVVFGMPRIAIQLGCVDHILPLTMIASKIRQLTLE